jgi:ketol-acid reductoisomerase
LLKNKKIVFLGFGNQGAAQAQNLRDSGIPNESILIANRADSYAEDAKSKGFIVEHDFAKAAGVADILFLLIPDQVQPGVFNEQFAPNLKSDATVVIASGYNVFFKLLQLRQGQDVVMVAPRSAFRHLKRSINSPSVIVQDDWKFCAFAVPERKGIPLLRLC